MAKSVEAKQAQLRSTDGRTEAGDAVFIVDNSDERWKVAQYLAEWAELSHTFDIATGYFEIGGLLALDGNWQKLDKLRILMGDEVSRATKKAFVKALTERAEVALDRSLEAEKEQNDFLTGVPGIVDALRSGKIECKVYGDEKFHAKGYITHARRAVVGSSALVGSSNFTRPGLTQNVELNVQIQREVSLLQDWFERHWDLAEDVTPELLRVVERHTREYTPFDVYVRALDQFFRGHELTAGEWEKTESKMFPVLDQYQREGYQALLKIARQFGGAFLCDGVGLGKTFVGLMLIERLVLHERKRVALFVPKAARDPVWMSALKKYLPDLGGGYTNLLVFNHTDLQRGGEYPEQLKRVREQADVIVIDEAHHFRNLGPKGEEGKRRSRYWEMFELAAGKTLFMLTATPVNNRLLDLQHMIELFSQRQPDYFGVAPLGIHSLPGHFRRLEKELEQRVVEEEASEGALQSEVGTNIATNQAEAERVLSGDPLVEALVVQRSRAYVKESQKQHGGNEAIFPEREDPELAKYSIKKTYGGLLEKLESAFSKEKPLFSLAVYYPLAYYIGSDESQEHVIAENRQKQIVSLVRTLFLKRFESSAAAFQMSCHTLLLKLLAFVTVHAETDGEKSRLERWKAQNAELIDYVQHHQLELFGEQDPEDFDEDVLSDELLESWDELPRDEYNVGEIVAETYLDLDQLADFLGELSKFKPKHDDKLGALIKLLKTDKVLKSNKVLIFTEYMATARYLLKHLAEAGIDGIDEVDSAVGRDRTQIIKQFAPYYNDSTSAQLAADGLDETRVLISTDVLSEGLNLQDATRLINYDLHWNPVRLMQRIGRVDRRLNPEIEKAMVTDHPEQKALRGKIVYWNFLAPGELDSLLKLYRRVSHKTLRISKVFGIEGKKLLRPEDDYNALQNFNHAYEGTTSSAEKLHLEYQELLKEHPELAERVERFPGRLFSGRERSKGRGEAVFLCYALPAPDHDRPIPGGGYEWTEDAGRTTWYLMDLATGKILEDAPEIATVVRSTQETERRVLLPKETLTPARKAIEKHIKNTYLKRVDAPVGVRPALKCWMELNTG